MSTEQPEELPTDTDHPVTLGCVLQVLTDHPKLTAWGYGAPMRSSVSDSYEIWERDFKSHRASLLRSMGEVRHCHDFLLTLTPTKTATAKSPSSYYLKHRAEEFGAGIYVCNGALITAALILKLPMWQARGGSYNPGIGVKRGDIPEASPGQRRY